MKTMTKNELLNSGEKVMGVAGRIFKAFEGDRAKVREATGTAQASFSEFLEAVTYGNLADARELLAEVIEELRPAAISLDVDHHLPANPLR